MTKVAEFAKQFNEPSPSQRCAEPSPSQRCAEPSPSQRCADPAYVRELRRHIYAPNVKPINELVDRLHAEHPDRFIPHVAPTYGGRNARILALFQSPGWSSTPHHDGPGMICHENVDSSSIRHKNFLDEYKIDIEDVVSWNAFPWSGYDKNRSLKEERQATLALEELLELLPNLTAVMLHGRVAQDAWERLLRHNPRAANRPYVIETYHTSARLVDPSSNSATLIERYENNLHEAFHKAAMHLRPVRYPEQSDYVQVDDAQAGEPPF
ncbi:uracil-DNA glycosylase [Rhodococcus sp. ARC_M6]|uniref:uracil-DNA glycosylase n=1 Tax=Rhodococcus sp. ARC_M6 TaxID=2928852 RepID=UPI001FB2D674|nr:uracil-DNA glycosylase [Rhodococcus sp. ARC_M6]MCJ0901858.1 uracil-DNA glycosylase [Rhodococcus sp. ARC_M6]